MSGRFGRDQSSRRDRFSHHQHHHSSSRFDEPKSSRSSRNPNPNPPSRHLWVGNLSHRVDQSTITDHFIRFGELENVIYQPGRSYAFVNFVREDDAIAAMNSPQGFNLHGLPLRIEFAKADKSSSTSRDEMHLQHRDEIQPPTNRSSTYSPRESRKRHSSPDPYFPDSSRNNERGTDNPTEILWIGFPSFLKVDETILRKAFSPFGDIEKITAFPGRTYAFVHFKNLSSARRAKETLQGKLFGNPRVHISFAKKDVHALSTSGPHLKRSNFGGSSDNLRSRRNIEESIEDPSNRVPYFPPLEYDGPDTMRSSRKESLWDHGDPSYGERRFYERGRGVGPTQEVHEYRVSPFRERSTRFHDFSPRKLQKTGSYREDPWDFPEDTHNSYHGSKKVKIDSFSYENELPDYPLHNLEQDKHDVHGFIPEQMEHPSNLNRNFGDGYDDNWRSGHDSFLSPSLGISSSIPNELKRNTLEFQQPEPKEWKWEGTIAKGGTPVCRARCFPVGKVMDICLPEFLDCTARTGLDMLAKHYYQAACAWVVFFVAASDADMAYYNEFMHYLGDKQRAAVSKLDDRNTLFLVPPSDFSQNVLKVPGKLSISGVVLSLEPCSPGLAPRAPPSENTTDQNLLYNNTHENNLTYTKMEFPSSSSSPFLNLNNQVSNYNPSFQENISVSAPYVFPGSNPYGQTVPRDSTFHAFPEVGSEGVEYSNLNSGRGGPDLTRVKYEGTTSYSSGLGANVLSSMDHKLQSFVPSNIGNLQQEQHAMVSPPLNPRPPPPGNEVYRSSGMILNPVESLSRVPTGYKDPNTNQGTSLSMFSQQTIQSDERTMFSHGAQPLGSFPGQGQGQLGSFPGQGQGQGQGQAQAQLGSFPGQGQGQGQAQAQGQGMGQGQGQGQGQSGNQEIVSMSNVGQVDNESDPQKRLQATLQLAAALLHQIQGKGP